MLKRKSKVLLLLAALSAIVFLSINKLTAWNRDRKVVMDLCQETKFTHAEDKWALHVYRSKSIFQSPEALRDSLLQEDLFTLTGLVREYDAALAAHKAEIQALGPNPSKDDLNRIEMLFSTGICERLTISQQAIWQEVSLLRNWRPGMGSSEVKDLVRDFDSKGLEIFTSTAHTSQPGSIR